MNGEASGHLDVYKHLCIVQEVYVILRSLYSIWNSSSQLPNMSQLWEYIMCKRDNTSTFHMHM
jgi:hypothetical protein